MSLPVELPSSPLRVFVYGTLKPGEFYYSQYCKGKVKESCEAIAYGSLYDLPLGYPAMTEGDRPVHGFLFTFTDPQALVDLDELEGYDPQGSIEQNEYDRRLIEVFSPDHASLGLAWTYVMTTEQAQKLRGILLPDGRWTGQKIRND